MITDPVIALADTGSQPNLIVQSILRKFGISGIPFKANVSGIMNSPLRIRKRLTVEIIPWFDSEESIETDLWVLPKESKWQPRLPDRIIHKNELQPYGVERLANPLFWQPNCVKLLLGIDIWTQIVEPHSHKVNNSILLQKTKLGDMLFGRLRGTEIEMTSPKVFSISEVKNEKLEKLFKSFLESEQLPVKAIKKSTEHILVEKIYKEGRTRDELGRFAVPIPLKANVFDIGSSKGQALKRFHSLERKFHRNPEFREKYIEFMRDYEQQGHMVKIDHPNEKKGMVYYIPHHGIISSGKFKAVFDASCKTDKNISLNEVQLVGAKLQKDLYEIILRFRKHKYAVNADIKKMFRQVEIIPEHWDLQRIFWREKETDPIQEYWLTTVTYGQASSPTNAILAMQEGANVMREKYPQASEAIINDFYMDDGLTGAETVEKAIKLAKEMKIVMESMGMNLTKWRSNSVELMKEMKTEKIDEILINDENPESVLGLKWKISSDYFTFVLKEKIEGTILTKRGVLSKVAGLYDPHGYLAPVITIGKIFIRKLWKCTTSWDERLSDDLVKEWQTFWRQIHEIDKVQIPRWIGTNSLAMVQLHGFCDAAESAYGAVTYVRTVTNDGLIKVILLTAKSKVAPININSIPKLELCGAELLARLCNSIQIAMEWEDISVRLWTDSTVTLQWIHKQPIDLKVFVGNRVSSIQENTKLSSWSHVKSKDNPADLISRGVEPKKLINNPLWWNGPCWLSLPENQWTKPLEIKGLSESNDILQELKVHSIVTKTDSFMLTTENGESIHISEYSNDLNHILRVISYVMRFVRIVKKRCVPQMRKRKMPKLISLPTNEERVEAMKYLVQKEQDIYYSNECKALSTVNEIKDIDRESINIKREKQKLPKGILEGSKLVSLHPILDKDGILRVGGRLKHAICPYEMKFPIIIPPNSRLSWLLINHAHQETKHGHVQVMTQYLRAKFWIPRLRLEARKFVNKCVTCVRYEHPLQDQLMGDLPFDRVNPGKPFLFTGIDYAGPLEIKEYLKTKTNKRKCWIAIFVCLITRAIHLDIVTDLTSAAFLQCYSRFVSRRGRCKLLRSDNATTFVGTEKELAKAKAIWNCQEVHMKLNNFGTEWQFMTPAAPHQGGIYEAAVKSTKYHLRRVIGPKSCTYEQFMTLLTEIEAILNSRPIYALNEDPNDIQALTPGHFLVGEPMKLPIPFALPPQTKASTVKFWNEIKTMSDHFWKRWYNEYLPSFQTRKKWRKENRDIAVGQIAIIHDENAKPANWLLGRITELIKGKDGLVRSVVLKTAKSSLSRPIQKICILPVAGADEMDTLQSFTLLNKVQRGTVSCATHLREKR